MAVWTEEILRDMFRNQKLQAKQVFYLSGKDIVTPAGQSFLHEKGITLQNGTGEKPEHMTHLRGDTLVPKNHPVIAFRGAIDSLESAIILAQVQAEEAGLSLLVTDLEEIIALIRLLIKAELTGESVSVLQDRGGTDDEDFQLHGLNAAGMREHSHHPHQYYGLSHFLPTYTHGRMTAVLNRLRTMSREAELTAYNAFCKEDDMQRKDIMTVLNRLSSVFWIMMFKMQSGLYGEEMKRK